MAGLRRPEFGTMLRRWIPVALFAAAGVASAGSPASNCCDGAGQLGCDDAACQGFICGFDPFCCDTAWDLHCGAQASWYCEVCGGTPPPVGACCATLHCFETWIDDCVLSGNQYLGDGTECGVGSCDNLPPLCPAPGSCCAPHATPGCEEAACCEVVCENDPFCCGLTWDEDCATQAGFLCEQPCLSACVGDYTGDGVTDSDDLNAVLAGFGADHTSADLNVVLGDFGCQ